MRPRAFLIRRERPSEQRAFAEGRKEAGRDDGTDDALDAVRASEPLPSATDVGEPGERRALGLPVEEGGVGRRPDLPLAILLGEHEQPILPGERQGAQQYAVHHAEDRRAGADGDRQGQDRGAREPGTLAQGPHGIAEVSE